MTLALGQRLHLGSAQHFVRGRQFLKQRGFVDGGHWRRLCHKEAQGFTGNYELGTENLLERMQIRQQILDLLVAHGLVKASIFAAQT